MLALFSSPHKFKGGKRIPALNLMREIMELQSSIPQRMCAVRPAARFPQDVATLVRDLSPRVIQFSGHGDAVKHGPFAGSLAFEAEDGTIQLPDPRDFIDLLASKRCPNLQCVFLNGCGTLRPLGAAIFAELPHLSVVGWDSITEDNAATAFSKVSKRVLVVVSQQQAALTLFP